MAGKKDIPMRIVKEKTGLTSRQIRYYDQKKLIFPDRTKGNQRLFSESDILRLEKIKSLLEKGYRIETVRKKLGTPISKASKYRRSPFDRYNKGDLSSLYPETKRTDLRKNLFRGKE